VAQVSPNPGWECSDPPLPRHRGRQAISRGTRGTKEQALPLRSQMGCKEEDRAQQGWRAAYREKLLPERRE